MKFRITFLFDEFGDLGEIEVFTIFNFIILENKKGFDWFSRCGNTGFLFDGMSLYHSDHLFIQ